MKLIIQLLKKFWKMFWGPRDIDGMNGPFIKNSFREDQVGALVPLTNSITQEQLGANVPGWFVKFLGPFNDFMTKVKYAMTGHMDYRTNIQCQIQTLTFQTGPNYISKQTFPVLAFTNNLPTNPFAISIAQIANTTSGQPTFDSPSIPIWSQNAGQITINWIGGLQNNSSYSITLLVR